MRSSQVEPLILPCGIGTRPGRIIRREDRLGRIASSTAGSLQTVPFRNCVDVLRMAQGGEDAVLSLTGWYGDIAYRYVIKPSE